MSKRIATSPAGQRRTNARAASGPDAGAGEVQTEHPARDASKPNDPDPIVSRLDPRTIRFSPWANRHTDAFTRLDFEKLKASIAQRGRNIQPVKVRPIQGPSAGSGDGDARPPIAFELIYGHRRHRACLELGLPVEAMIEPMTDQALLAEMDRENRTHAPLSPFEQGRMFDLALKDKLYPSARALAQDLGIDESLVSKSLSIARLPPEVIRAFVSPLDIQYRWAGPLNEAHRKDPSGLIARANYLQADRGRFNSVRIFERLVATSAPRKELKMSIAGRGGKASMGIDRKGRLAILVQAPWEPGLPKQIESVLRDIFNQR